MCYAVFNAYIPEADASVRYTVGEIPGAHLCDTVTGVTVNGFAHAPQSRYGDASQPRGSCRQQILVNDAVSPPQR